MTTTSATDQLESGTVLDDGRQVTVYTPPRTAMPPLRPYLASVWERRALMWQMTRSNLKARHYNTVFGQVWLLVDPLLTAAVFYLLRSVIRPIGGPEERNLLVAHLIMAIFFFFYMSDSVIGGSKSIMRHRQLLLNSPFPRAMFPVTHVLQAIFDFLPMLAVYTILHAILGQPFTWALLWVPVIFVALTMFGLGGALLFSTLSVLYRDVGTLLPYMSRIWMYVTPVLYLVAEIPERFRTALQMNPLYPSFAALEVTFQGHAPPAQYLVAAFAWGIASLLLGGTVFLLKERNLAIRI